MPKCDVLHFQIKDLSYNSVTREREREKSEEKNWHSIPHKEFDVCSEEGRVLKKAGYKNHKLDIYMHYSLKSPNDKTLLSLSPPSI